jgi:ADP-heptose:LPS heptosyltransferase
LIDLTAHIHDFADTGALVHHLDLVISVDTAIVHLAAAMAKPTWILLAKLPDWRWMLNRMDSPWYPSVRLFRQRQRGNWEDVVQDIRAELVRLVGASPLTG